MSRWDLAKNHRRQALAFLGLNAVGLAAGLVNAAATS